MVVLTGDFSTVMWTGPAGASPPDRYQWIAFWCAAKTDAPVVWTMGAGEYDPPAYPALHRFEL